MDINMVKSAMQKGTTVEFQGIECVIFEYRLKLCRNSASHNRSGKVFYHTLVLKDKTAPQSFYEVLLEDVEIIDGKIKAKQQKQ